MIGDQEARESEGDFDKLLKTPYTMVESKEGVRYERTHKLEELSRKNLRKRVERLAPRKKYPEGWKKHFDRGKDQEVHVKRRSTLPPEEEKPQKVEKAKSVADQIDEMSMDEIDSLLDEQEAAAIKASASNGQRRLVVAPL